MTRKPEINFHHVDCMNFLQELPDKAFQLAICDPPYGETCKLTGGKAAKDGYVDYWDRITDKDSWNIAPPRNLFQRAFSCFS